MADSLNPHEARVLGVLVEKAFTTPDQYPLSLHAATTGSNQKSNRNPVVHFTEPEVDVALQGLRMKHVAGSAFPAGSRVEKWTHSAREHYGVDDQGLAVLAELLLRGPQTPGELRGRANRMRTIATLDVLNGVLARLIDKGYVQRLAPLPGSRAERYGQTLAPRLALDGEPEPGESAGPAATPPASGTGAQNAPAAPGAPGAARPGPAGGSGAPPLEPRVAALESEVRRLRAALCELAGKLGETIEDDPALDRS